MDIPPPQIWGQISSFGSWFLWKAQMKLYRRTCQAHLCIDPQCDAAWCVWLRRLQWINEVLDRPGTTAHILLTCPYDSWHDLCGDTRKRIKRTTKIEERHRITEEQELGKEALLPIQNRCLCHCGYFTVCGNVCVTAWVLKICISYLLLLHIHWTLL